MDVVPLTLFHPRVKKIESNEVTIATFRIRADVEQDCEIVAAFQVPHSTGKDFWVVGLWDEDNGGYATTWYDGEWSGGPFASYEGLSPKRGKHAALGAAHGYAIGFSEFNR